MTTWSEVSVGDVVINSADDFDGEYFVKAIKKQGRRLRVVLSPNTNIPAAKVAIFVTPDEEVDLPEGAKPLDKYGDLIRDELGGRLAATATDDGLVCPAMDVTLIASHLKIFHGVDLRGLPVKTEDELLKIHEELHEAPFHEPEYEHTHEGSDGQET